MATGAAKSGSLGLDFRDGVRDDLVAHSAGRRWRGERGVVVDSRDRRGSDRGRRREHPAASDEGMPQAYDIR